jgi:hypothetical protein
MDEEKIIIMIEKIKNVLQKLNEEDKTLFNHILNQNQELLFVVLDLQEFLLSQGLTSEDFVSWRNEKDERTYH